MKVGVFGIFDFPGVHNIPFHVHEIGNVIVFCGRKQRIAVKTLVFFVIQYTCGPIMQLIGNGITSKGNNKGENQKHKLFESCSHTISSVQVKNKKISPSEYVVCTKFHFTRT